MPHLKRRPKTRWKSNIAQFFLAQLLVVFAGYLCLYLAGLVSLMVGLAIGNALLIVRDITISLSRWSL